jgi:hypothetical protein
MMLMSTVLGTRMRRLRVAPRAVAPAARVAEPPDTPLAGSPWRVFAEESAMEVREPSRDQLLALAPGAAVVLVSDRPLSRWRLRRTARLAGVRVDRELIAIPTSRRPQIVLDDAPAVVRHFWRNVAMVPPGIAALGGPAEVALRAARLLPTSWTGAIAPGRVLVGRKQ